ncbi:hypothetical protein [Allofournierella massiliensis]|uniref:hypothetical protein n=1 Tax=Allofournierella massiliensis TaxID=1650663 RepID=UPI0035683D25
MKNFIILNHESQGKVDYSDHFSQTNAHFSLFSKRRKKKAGGAIGSACSAL